MKVAIVGAGNNSDYHIRFAKMSAGVQLVGIADTDHSRAVQVAARHGIDGAFSSAADMLRQARPDVVHVVTPPTTHVGVVREALEAGCHVLVEKPLALKAEDATALYEVAERHGVQLCPVHNHLFDPCMLRAEALIQTGKVGRVVSVESHYGLNTQIPAFRDYPQPNVLPWLYRLPGGVYQDFLPHALYPVLHYVGRARAIRLMHRATGVLPQGLPDEIRILIDGERGLGTVTISFAARPHLHFIRMFGTDGMVEVDINTMTTTVHAVSALPKAAQKASFNLEDSWQKTRSTAANVFDFVTGRLQPYQGMSTLIQRFYRAIETGAPPPVSREQGVGVVEASDTIIEQLEIKPLRHEAIGISAPRPTARRVLVTGGTGFLGRAVVRRFVSEGFAVRVLARKLSTVDAVVQMGAEVYWGDVGDLASFQEAAAGCELIVHLAAGTSGSERDSQIATVDGTRNLLEVCRRQQPTKLVYVSSCSVYGVADHHGSAAVAETAPLERFPERRGAYSASKQEAESLVTAYMRAGGVPAVILRPGTIYGPGGELFTGMMGFSMGSTYVVIGMGGFVLPLTYVDNVADAILQSAVRAEADGEIFNVVDAERLTKRQYVNRVIRRVDPKARVFYLPYPLLYGLTWTQEMAFGLLKRHPVLTRYRLTSSQKQIVYDGRRMETRLGWKAPVRLDDALSQLVRTETTRRERPTVAPVPVAIAAPSQSLR